MLRLLPPVCRDCGKSPKRAELSPYLDFVLCAACISKRERDVREVDTRRRKAAPKKGSTKKAEGSAGKKADAKRRGSSRRRR